MQTKRVVIKIGTHVLTRDTETLNRDMIQSIASTVHVLGGLGVEVVLVSSGAVAAGTEVLGKNVGREVRAAVGQVKLMEVYESAFAEYNTNVGQVLLTRSDFRNRSSYENARATLTKLLEQHIVPVINENDVTTTHELSFGDNDSLAAYTAIALGASHLFFLTNQEGLFDSDPHENPKASLIANVENIETVYQSVPRGISSSLGLGGIFSKVKAARLATSAGVETWIMSGFDIGNVVRVLGGEHIGTRLAPQQSSPSPRERWILCANNADARLVVDVGAARALRERKSLLAVGVRRALGSFNSQDIVEIIAGDGNTIGYGVTNYGAEEIRSAISGKAKLDREVIHTNNLRLI